MRKIKQIQIQKVIMFLMQKETILYKKLMKVNNCSNRHNNKMIILYSKQVILKLRK